MFSRPRLANLYGLIVRPVQVAAPGEPATRVPPFIERLWMPAYAVRFRTVARDKPGIVWVAIDGWSGQFTLFERESELASREIEEDCFPPSLAEDDAVVLARHGLMQYILRRRNAKKPVVEDAEEIRLYHSPLWVLYFRRRRRFLDVKVLDGYTGSPGGSKLRAAVVNALVAARKERLAGGTR